MCYCTVDEKVNDFKNFPNSKGGGCIGPGLQQPGTPIFQPQSSTKEVARNSIIDLEMKHNQDKLNT